MRQPSTKEQLFAAWAEALASGVSVHRDAYAGTDLCGWWSMRMVRGGPNVPVRTWCYQAICPESCELLEPERLICEVGQARDQYRIQSREVVLKPITEERYDLLMTERFVAASHTPVDLEKEIFTP